MALWVRAVSLRKDNTEEEFVCPKKWIDESKKCVFWPRRRHKALMDSMTAPDSSWEVFELVKVKYASGK